MIDRFDVVLRRLRHAVSQTRWSARFAGHKPESTQLGKPGVLLIQIDGLGERLLRKALAQGHMPFLRRLIERDGSEIRSLYTGLPSSTPAFQAELFYGESGVVPSFCFYDPIVKRVLSLNEPAAACIIEGRLKVRSSGLLRGGSAWSNIFSGGAAESQLCASTVGLRRTLMGLSPRRMVILGVWHIWSVFRAAGHLALVIALAFWDLFRGALSRREFLLEVKFIPLRVLVGVVMREIVVAGASIDLLRGLPIVQLNLLGYDEHAHRRGPDSRFALWSLRGIDHSIRRVWQAAQRSRPRDYQIWVYSDHGQERVVTYEKRHGETVGTMVRRVYASLVEERGRASVSPENASRDAGPEERTEVESTEGVEAHEGHVETGDIDTREEGEAALRKETVSIE